MRKLAIFSAAFAAGTLIAVYLLELPWILPAAGLAALPGVVCLIPAVKKRLRGAPVTLVCLALALGLGWTWGYDYIFVNPARAMDGVNAEITCRVTGYSEYWRYGHRADADVTLEGRTVRARIYYYSDIELAPGDEITVTADFSSTDTVGEESTVTILSRGYQLYGFARNNIELTGHTDSLRYIPKQVSRAMSERLAEIFPEDVSAFLKAMLLGLRTEISDNLTLTNAFSNAGIYHILAVSGLHVSFFTGLIYTLLGRRRWTAAIIIPLTLFFMAVTGFTPSVVRAGIMQIFLVTAPLVRRESDSVTSLFASLFIMLGLNPYAIAHAGLQMSFLATLGIITLSSKIASALIKAAGITAKSDRTRGRKARDGLLRFVIVSLSVTVGALAFTVPVSALYFERVSLIAPLTNLLVIWIASFIFAGGLIVCLIGFISVPLASILGLLVTIGVRYVLWIVRHLGTATLAAVYTVNRLVLWWLVFTYLAAALFMLFRGKLRHIYIPITASVAVLCAVLIVTALNGDSDPMAVTALDVGEGQCVAVTMGRITLAVDCGGGYEAIDPGNRLAEYVLSMGRAKLDAMMITHYDSDHCCGADELLQRVKVGVLLLPDPALCQSEAAQTIISLAQERGTEIVYVTEDVHLSFPDGEMTVFAPLTVGESNEMSLSAVISQGENDLVITGDMGVTAERMLIISKSLPDAELLIAGHHGAAGSTGKALLDTVKPEKVIISCGKNNSYGHPAEETVERISAEGAEIYRTDELGNVTIRFGE